MSTHPSFGTILIRRKNNERPPGKSNSFTDSFLGFITWNFHSHSRPPLSRLIEDFELRLRPLCQKIRIVDKLNGNPHLMVAGSPSLAVRMYNIHDIQRLEKERSDGSINHDANGGVDGLQHFRDSYENSIVFFILPLNHQRDQLSRRESFLHAAQRTNIRILIVADVSQAISAMQSVIQSLAPEKREKKRKYFAQIAEQNYLPSSMMMMGGGGGIEPTQEGIANYAKNAMISWAERMEMQQGDINVALDMLGSIANMVTASDRDLDNIPITTASKDVIRQFFGGIARDARESADGETDSDLFGDIDDAELLNIPDPCPAENVAQVMYNQRERSYDEFDLPPVGHGHSSYESQARDFYTPINPAFARRRLDQGYHHHHDAPHYGYSSNEGMGYITSHYPSANDSYQGEYDDYGHSRSVRHYTNQFL